MKTCNIVLSVAVFCLGGMLRAQVPQMVNYQGRLDSAGVPLNGAITMSFAIYADSSTGPALWTEPPRTVSVTQGVFSVLLGSPTPFPTGLFADSIPRWLGITVSGSELKPRSRFSSVAYGLQAGSVPNNSVTGAKIADGSITGADIADASISQSKVSFSPLLSSSDYGRSGVASTLYEGSVSLANRYLSLNGGTITGGGVWVQNVLTMQKLGQTGAGVVATYGPSGNLATFTTTGSSADDGMILCYRNGSVRAAFGVNSAGAGMVEVYNASGVLAYQMSGSGTKNFVEQHPTDNSKLIFYTCLEGPEAAVYFRGTGMLNSGQAIIQLPDEFRFVAADSGLTVQVTPLSETSKGLAVVGKSSRSINVKELSDGKGTYAFDFLIHAVRLGFERYQVIRDKNEASLSTKGTALPTGSGSQK
jgi:hypothetical protein